MSHQQRDLGTTRPSDQVHRLDQSQPVDVFAIHRQDQVSRADARLFGRRAGNRGDHRKASFSQRNLRADTLEVTSVPLLFPRVLFRAEIRGVRVLQSGQHSANCPFRQILRVQHLVVDVFVQQDAIGLADGSQFSG